MKPLFGSSLLIAIQIRGLFAYIRIAIKIVIPIYAKNAPGIGRPPPPAGRTRRPPRRNRGAPSHLSRSVPSTSTHPNPGSSPPLGCSTCGRARAWPLNPSICRNRSCDMVSQLTARSATASTMEEKQYRHGERGICGEIAGTEGQEEEDQWAINEEFSFVSSIDARHGINRSSAFMLFFLVRVE